MFTNATFTFLDELSANNNRTWFTENKARYESLVREPALDFISAMAGKLVEISPSFQADARKTGGSLLRVFRDTRFSRDKTPYKTNIGIQFRHAQGKDIHAPGFYLHIASDECFLGAGCWHPDSDTLQRIREQIASDPESWFKARNDEAFQKNWALAGESLTRPPRGFAADHPAIDDLKRKDFIALAEISRKEIFSPDLVELVTKRFIAATPLVNYLCRAQGIQY